MKRRLLPLVVSTGLMVVISLVSPPPASAQAYSFTVSATQGLQDSGIDIPAYSWFRVEYVSGTWTVDHRNFGYVDANGHPADIDQRINPECKHDERAPYGHLLGESRQEAHFPGWYRIGNSGEFRNHWETDMRLYFRINDIDRCLVDNAGSVTVNVIPFFGAR
jgi:hypothetical protein